MALGSRHHPRLLWPQRRIPPQPAQSLRDFRYNLVVGAAASPRSSTQTSKSFQTKTSVATPSPKRPSLATKRTGPVEHTNGESGRMSTDPDNTTFPGSPKPATKHIQPAEDTDNNITSMSIELDNESLEMSVERDFGVQTMPGQTSAMTHRTVCSKRDPVETMVVPQAGLHLPPFRCSPEPHRFYRLPAYAPEVHAERTLSISSTRNKGFECGYRTSSSERRVRSTL